MIFVLLLKWEDSHCTNAQKYIWRHNLSGHPSSLNLLDTPVRTDGQGELQINWYPVTTE